jgi:pyruvate/2-oxoglutarate dehydrogenase complex dihydrolipoamide dehydrogenase (E3) component
MGRRHIRHEVRLLGTRDGSDFATKDRSLLVAGGRAPNTSGRGLELAGVEAAVLKANERLQTTAEGVWAVGDCASFTKNFRRGVDSLRHSIRQGREPSTGAVRCCAWLGVAVIRVRGV